MKDENQASTSSRSRLFANPAPSLRVPVTSGNRALLRWLRAAELSAWEAGRLWSGSYASAETQGPTSTTPTTLNNCL